MKKTIAFVSILVFALAIVGCNKAADDSTSGSNTAANTNPTVGDSKTGSKPGAVKPTLNNEHANDTRWQPGTAAGAGTTGK